MIQTPDLEKSFTLRTDASKYAFGNVLSQKDENGLEIIISVESRQFKDAQIHWSIGLKELFGSAQGVKRNIHFLEGRKFKLVTDNKSVFFLLKNRKEIQLSAANPLTRLFMFLITFDFEMIWSQAGMCIVHFCALFLRCFCASKFGRFCAVLRCESEISRIFRCFARFCAARKFRILRKNENCCCSFQRRKKSKSTDAV